MNLLRTGQTTFRRLSSARLSVLLFLLLWFAYGAAINSSNLIDFDLQHVCVEAIVERGHFYLEHSIPSQRQSKGDVFTYEGHNYAAKQPGQFMLGALVYVLLRKVGLSYANNYLLTSALVTFFTSSFVLAVSGVALFGIARELSPDGRNSLRAKLAGRVGNPLLWPLAATLSYALATTAFAYSGIAHHDVLATGYLVIASYFSFRLSRGNTSKRMSFLLAASAGLFLGLTLTTSMLPFFMAVFCGLYFLSLRRFALLPVFVLGLLVGLMPLFIYDAVSFGNPFLLPNVAGAAMFSDTFFYFDPRNFGDKLAFYASLVAAYLPILAVGLLGLSYYPRQAKRSRQFLTLLAMMVVLMAFVLNIKSDGDCQFGPRYLLPAMPFACLGIAGFAYLSSASERWLAAFVAGVAGTLSFLINLVGALRGAMNCPHGENAFWNDLTAIQNGGALVYPLARWLLLPLLACTTLFLLNLLAQGKRRAVP